jgi:hypothetical protein
VSPGEWHPTYISRYCNTEKWLSRPMLISPSVIGLFDQTRRMPDSSPEAQFHNDFMPRITRPTKGALSNRASSQSVNVEGDASVTCLCLDNALVGIQRASALHVVATSSEVDVVPLCATVSDAWHKEWPGVGQRRCPYPHNALLGHHWPWGHKCSPTLQVRVVANHGRRNRQANSSTAIDRDLPAGLLVHSNIVSLLCFW